VAISTKATSDNVSQFVGGCTATEDWEASFSAMSETLQD